MGEMTYQYILGVCLPASGKGEEVAVPASPPAYPEEHTPRLAHYWPNVIAEEAGNIADSGGPHAS